MTATGPTFSGAVLAGGRSRRMGRDKAFLEHEGRPLAGIARSALLEAGAAEVLSVGGDCERLERLGFTAIPDEVPGEGPLGGLLTALRAAESRWVAVLSCDLPHAGAGTIRELLSHAGEGVDAVAPLLDGRPLATHAVWRRDCRDRLGSAFAAGERRLGAALELVRVRSVPVRDPGTLIDVDTPEDLRAAPAGAGPASDPRIAAATPAGGGTGASRPGAVTGRTPEAEP